MAVRASDRRARKGRAIMVMVTGLVMMASASVHGAASGGPDFDGDGFEDLVIGVPGEEVGGNTFAGGVHVIYGRSGGLNEAGDEFWTQDTDGVHGASGEFEDFGYCTTWGDFDTDGYDDLAIGIPFEDVGGMNAAGAVAVLYGSPGGLSAAGDQLWHREVTGVRGNAETNAGFGSAVAAGDFDGDGKDDLAIGVPSQEVEGNNYAGEVHVLYGSGQGLTASGDEIFNQDSDGLADDAEEFDLFGVSLAAGDFDGDGREDLAIGVAGETPATTLTLAGPPPTTMAGAVQVLYGNGGGLSGNDQFLYQGGFAGAIAGEAEAFEFFGHALAVGDYDGNGKDDLAVGIPQETNNQTLCGAVHVFYGGSNGLRLTDDEIWTQDSPGVLDEEEASEFFGSKLAAGDFDRNGKDDLAIGVHSEDVDGAVSAGAVNVLYGSSGGLTASGDQFWTQNSSGVRDQSEGSDRFGNGLTCGDFDGDGRDDLAVSAPFEDLNGQGEAGGVNVIYGKNSNGLNQERNQFWHQDKGSINDTAQENDYFGAQFVNIPT